MAAGAIGDTAATTQQREGEGGGGAALAKAQAPEEEKAKWRHLTLERRHPAATATLWWRRMQLAQSRLPIRVRQEMRSCARCTANLPHLHCVGFRRRRESKKKMRVSWGVGWSLRSCSRRGVSGGGDPSLIGRLRRCSSSVIGLGGCPPSDLTPTPSPSTM